MKLPVFLVEGGLVTDAQVRRLREKRLSGKTLAAAAAAAGMSERTARDWQRGALPSTVKSPRWWRTREDPFADVWQLEMVPQLVADTRGRLQVLKLFAWLCRRHHRAVHEEGFQVGVRSCGRAAVRPARRARRCRRLPAGAGRHGSAAGVRDGATRPGGHPSGSAHRDARLAGRAAGRGLGGRRAVAAAGRNTALRQPGRVTTAVVLRDAFQPTSNPRGVHRTYRLSLSDLQVQLTNGRVENFRERRAVGRGETHPKGGKWTPH